MCGRYSQTKALAELKKRFPFGQGSPEWLPRFNLAAGQQAPVIINEGLSLKLMRWGLVPFWANDEKIGYKMINARAETIADRPAYRNSFERKRCLVLADGFYEWKKTTGLKSPYRFVMRDQAAFAFAGLWDSWKGREGGRLETFTIITTTPNELCQSVHDRMPVILGTDDYEQWLDRKVTESAKLTPLLRSYPAEEMLSYPVSTIVNNARNDDPRCTEPLASRLDFSNHHTTSADRGLR